LTPWLWAIFTILAAGGQTLRNAMQKELTTTLGTVAATHVRFLFGLPFGLLFLALVAMAEGRPPSTLNSTMLTWTVVAALAQIGATALLLAAMRERSFVVTTAYSKTEPVQVALFGLIFLGDHLSAGLTAAIMIATAGVLLMSWPKQTAGMSFSWESAFLGVGSGALFAIAAVGFRGGIRALGSDSFVLAASTTLVVGLIIQTAILSLYLLLRDREKLVAILKAWRPSLTAGFMGAFASQMWFLAFAIESAAKVRTLGLVEILFAQLVSRQVFRQKLASREAVGIGLIVAGVVLLLNLS
jgi:drug/metabolite transporter (DMT)-like permease